MFDFYAKDFNDASKSTSLSAFCQISTGLHFFFIHSNKNLQYEFTSYTTYRILNYTTRTMPLSAKCYDYSVASQKTKTTYI